MPKSNYTYELLKDEKTGKPLGYKFLEISGDKVWPSNRELEKKPLRLLCQTALLGYLTEHAEFPEPHANQDPDKPTVTVSHSRSYDLLPQYYQDQQHTFFSGKQEAPNYYLYSCVKIKTKNKEGYSRYRFPELGDKIYSLTNRLTTPGELLKHIIAARIKENKPMPLPRGAEFTIDKSTEKKHTPLFIPIEDIETYVRTHMRAHWISGLKVNTAFKHSDSGSGITFFDRINIIEAPLALVAPLFSKRVNKRW